MLQKDITIQWLGWSIVRGVETSGGYSSSQLKCRKHQTENAWKLHVLETENTFHVTIFKSLHAWICCQQIYTVARQEVSAVVHLFSSYSCSSEIFQLVQYFQLIETIVSRYVQHAAWLIHCMSEELRQMVATPLVSWICLNTSCCRDKELKYLFCNNLFVNLFARLGYIAL